MATTGYYRLEFVPPENPSTAQFRLSSAAVLTCGLCSDVISGSGGGEPAICEPCGDLLASGRLATVVTWEAGDEANS